MQPITDAQWAEAGATGKNLGFQFDEPVIFSTLSIAAQKGIQCHGCGRCCYSTTVTVSIPEARVIAKHLGMSFKEFMKEHIVREPTSQYGYAFRTVPCQFLVDNRCTIYEVRPSVCRNFPFLSRGPDAIPNMIYIPGTCLAAREAWDKLAEVIGVK